MDQLSHSNLSFFPQRKCTHNSTSIFVVESCLLSKSKMWISQFSSLILSLTLQISYFVEGSMVLVISLASGISNQSFGYVFYVPFTLILLQKTWIYYTFSYRLNGRVEFEEFNDEKKKKISAVSFKVVIYILFLFPHTVQISWISVYLFLGY